VRSLRSWWLPLAARWECDLLSQGEITLSPCHLTYHGAKCTETPPLSPPRLQRPQFESKSHQKSNAEEEETVQITPAVNYSPLCKPRENRPFGFPATGQWKQRLLACLLLVQPKAREPPGHTFLGLTVPMRTCPCALCLSCFQPRTNSWVLSSASPRLGPRPSSCRAAVGGHRGHSCLLVCANPACTEGTALRATVQDYTPAAVCLSVCGESPVDILGSFLQSAAKADARCPCRNSVKKIRGTGCVKEKPERSLHLTSFSFSNLDNRLGASVNRRELF